MIPGSTRKSLVNQYLTTDRCKDAALLLTGQYQPMLPAMKEAAWSSGDFETVAVIDEVVLLYWPKQRHESVDVSGDFSLIGEYLKRGR